jgi:hypothetical protein
MSWNYNYRDVDITAAGNWNVCGSFLSDHDWTIHVPEHKHANGDAWGSRSIHGNDTDLMLAIRSHLGLNVYGACNWCAIIVEDASTDNVKASTQAIPIDDFREAQGWPHNGFGGEK